MALFHSWSFPRSSWLALLIAAALVAGCSSTQRASESSADAAGSVAAASEQMERRDYIAPLEPAQGFMEAVEADTRTTRGVPGPDYWQQEASYTIDAQIFPEDRRLEAVAQIRYTNNAPEPLSNLVLELAQNHHKEGVVRSDPAEVTGGINLTRVSVNGQALQEANDGPRYRTSNTELIIIPPESVAPGETVQLELAYNFTIPQAGAGGRMGYSRDNLFFLAYWYPIVSVYDDVTGWMSDSFLGTAEFYSDFADYTYTVEAPEGWVVQGTGALQNPDEVLAPEVRTRMREAHNSDEPMMVLTPDQFGTERAENGRLTWRFQADRVRDVAFSLTRASYWEAARTPVGDRDGDGTVDSTYINTFFRPEAPLWEEVTAYQQHSITFLSEYLDYPYPWPHMTAVEGAGIIGGGMEFPMMTIMGSYNGRDARALYAVTAHELAHMWVPMIVSTNERRYSWIDEGTTSFNENVARKDYYDNSNSIESDMADYIQVAESGIEAPIMRWSDFHYNGLAYVTASYRKPATLLAMLRGLLGEETFQNALQDFISTWAYKHPYPADFFNTFERVSGQDLDWFWRSWYYETWQLDHAVTDVTTQGQQTQITVEDQGQAYMPARLTITLANGETVTREVPVATWLDGQREAVVTVDGDVERVELDAEQHFPDVDRDDNTWTAGDTAANPSSRR